MKTESTSKKKKKKKIPPTKKSSLKDLPEDDRSIDFSFRHVHHNVPLLGNLQVKYLSINEVKEALNKNAAQLTYFEDLKSSVDSAIQELEDKFEVVWSRWYVRTSKDNPKATEGFKKSTIIVKNSKQYKLYLRNKRALNAVRGKVKSLVKGYETQSRTLQSIAGLSKQQLASLGGDLSSRSTGNKNLEDM